MNDVTFNLKIMIYRDQGPLKNNQRNYASKSSPNMNS